MLLIDCYIALKKSSFHVSIQEIEYVYMENRVKIANADELVEAVKRGRNG